MSSQPDRVFRELTEAVLEGRYAPGDRLPPQRTLAEELDTNMASLREGIKRLEQLRLLEVRHGDAMRVTDWRRAGGLDVLAYAVLADPALLDDLFEARRLLLTEAARLAAGRRTGDEAQQLQHLAASLAEATDPQAVDLLFFAQLIEAGHNLVFTLILNSIRGIYLEHAERFRAIADPGLAGHYVAIAEAVTRQDAGRAAEAAEELARRQQERIR